jgi:hypothetical protein
MSSNYIFLLINFDYIITTLYRILSTLVEEAVSDAKKTQKSFPVEKNALLSLGTAKVYFFTFNYFVYIYFYCIYYFYFIVYFYYF